DLRPIQKRLYNYFERRMGSTNTENRASWLREIVTYDLLLASTTAAKEKQQSDNPWIVMQSTVQARVERALLRFRSLFEGAYNAHRMAEAEAILVAAEEQSNILAPQIRDWLVFYRAKINHAGLHLAEAIECYNHLLKRDELDPELRGLTAISLGDVQVENGSWTAAITSYQSALELPKLDQQQVAAAHLGIADAYNELAISAGGWLQTRRPENFLLRLATRAFLAVAVLPMLILVSMLRRMGAAVPPAPILLRYQNWTLARIFRASREQVQAAYAIYKERNDHTNMARCETRLIDIDIRFENVKDALTMAQQVLERHPSEDGYRRARIQLTVARALMAARQTPKAIEEASAALAIFRSVDDGRWETRALTALARMHTQMGDSAKALECYRQALARALEIGSVLSRERILYELRVLRHSTSKYPPEIDQILDSVPTQRFVSRFPRFLLPYLQAGQTIVIPGIMLLSAIVAPSQQGATILRTPNNLLITDASTFTFPWQRLLISPLVVGLVVAASYAVLALIVLWRLPLTKLRQNQPDIMVFEPDELIHYDQHGQRAHQIAWRDVRLVTSADRAIWRRPLPVFSRVFVTSANDETVRIEGVIGWYSTVRKLLFERIKRAGATYTLDSYDFSLLRSVSGLLLALGIGMMALIMASNNHWIPDLARILPPTGFALMQQVAYSGALVIGPLVYWMVVRPMRLQNEFSIDSRLPWLLAAVGLAIVVVFIVTKGRIVPLPTFSMALFLTGMFILIETIFHISGRRLKWRTSRPARTAVHILALALGGLLVWKPLAREFYHSRSHANNAQGRLDQAASDRLKEQSYNTGLFSEDLPLLIGAESSSQGQWAAAKDTFQHIIDDPRYDAQTKGLAYHNLAQNTLNRCLQPGETCNQDDMKQIIEYENVALGLINDRRGQSAAWVTWGSAHYVLGETVPAEDAFEKAVRLNDNPQDQQQLREFMEIIRKSR
ncbi:MAG TPA: tetratricopeptide repeat protein, partial [Herpetosiphonaceae bacterium]|nr:tetratricopeptide repeat protein [Herpetosiphonaceae bacterium]